MNTSLRLCRWKYFEEKSLYVYSLFRNVSPERFFDLLREIGVLYTILGVLW